MQFLRSFILSCVYAVATMACTPDHASEDKQASELNAAAPGCTDNYGFIYSDGAAVDFSSGTYVCTGGAWYIVKSNATANNGSCIGADGRSYQNGVVTIYQGGTYTCSNGNWVTGSTQQNQKSCLGVDNKTSYKHGVITTYMGARYLCQDGKWINQ